MELQLKYAEKVNICLIGILLGERKVDCESWESNVKCNILFQLLSRLEIRYYGVNPATILCSESAYCLPISISDTSHIMSARMP
jgi:hypothetical protein